MSYNGQDTKYSGLEEDRIRLFQDNHDFHERLGLLEEIAPDYAAYSHNCINSAFHHAISRKPLDVPLRTSSTSPPSRTSSGRQTRIVEYFTWSRKFPCLPMEVILEIASHLTPLALLCFSRTSRLFRKTLMNKASRWVWRGALGTVLGLPPCPDDLNEALYAALVFDNHCFACGSSDAFSVDYALRLRLCDECWDANVCPGSDFLDGVSHGVYPFVFMLLPSANTFNFKSFRDVRTSLTRVNPQTHLTQDWYYQPELQALLDFFWPKLLTVGDLAKLKAEFLDRAEQVVRRQTHAVELYAWERVIGAGGHAVPNVTLQRATEDRYYLDLAFSMGMHMDPQWDEILADDDDDYVPPPTKRTIAQGEALNAHPPKSKAQIAKEHQKRATRESIAYDMRLEDRYDELEQWYEELLEDEVHLNEDELPNAHDGARLFAALATRNDARAGIHDDSVGALEESALARARMYTFDVRSALAALLPPPGPHKDTRAFLRETLARPTALFACAFPECRGDHGFEWPEINYHWREQHRDESVWATSLGVTQHRYIRARVWTEGVELANRILDVVGLPRDTPMHRLDKLCEKRRLGCACGDPYLQDESPVWGRLVRHVHDHLKMDKCRRPCDGIPWINDHSDLESCIKLLPKGANKKAAFAPTSADSETIAYVEAFRAKRPAGSCLECLLCEAMLRRKRKKAISFGGRAFMLPIAEELVYHMQAKHGIPFDEKNVAFRPPYSEPPPEKTEVDLRRFCLDSASDF